MTKTISNPSPISAALGTIPESVTVPPLHEKDPQWYKDAVIYQTHIKAFADSNSDGIGDFEGLISKLDYIAELGVSAIWLLPFYPSPLRDDGYDISDYRTVNPAYGTMRDVRRLVHEAHRRNLRVITELVINHTSDQHPWFQKSRAAKPGSKWRDYYVWSDSDQKYKDTRIIFIDTEKSNWTWDPVAGAYYWHRFYSHQPDLNFDNPRVMDEVLALLRYWLDMGIDGLRLDAIPYLIERDGTNCENLPETHGVLKRIRAAMEERYPDKMLLAEANQWPEDTRPYFGDGDECHMAFHFPLMPRMYMAIAQEDRHPITDVMRQTPEIPENCQWAIFLRNHDELTLEMVTENEREYLWNTYAADRRMRINLGIRRRLAPLLDNDRRRIELMNALLFSMPGTPVVYYGDEIGMGDNIYLGDRDGVRTPMQWSVDRNGGFSRAQPQRLYSPLVQDPIYGYQAVNVEAQQQSPSALLNWMKRIIAVRQGRKTFGRGSLTFLYPRNRKTLCYLREYESETILCIFNLSRNAQAVDLDLRAYKDRIPVDLIGRSPFPPITEQAYRFTLPPHAFFWFTLAEASQVSALGSQTPEPLPDFITMVLGPDYQEIRGGHAGRDLVLQVMPEYLPKQRWFAAKDRVLQKITLGARALLREPQGGGFFLGELEVAFKDAADQRYLLPLTIAWGEEHLDQNSALLPYILARVRRGPKIGVLYDATQSDEFPRRIIRMMAAARDIAVEGGKLKCYSGRLSNRLEIEPDVSVRRLNAEQSNTSILVGDDAIVKIYRRLEPGIHPEPEIGRFLTDVAGFANTPPLLGSIERIAEDGTSCSYAACFGFVANQGDGWSFTLDHIDRTLDEYRVATDEVRASEEPHGMYLAIARLLGQRTGEMHKAFAIDTDDPAFAREPLTREDLELMRREVRQQVEAGFAALEAAREGASDAMRASIDEALTYKAEAEQIIDAIAEVPEGLTKTRFHGDYHLGQVLIAQGDIMILDFEGEPAKSIDERRAKSSPIKDVAGMMRSFDYAAWAAVFRYAESDPAAFDSLLVPALSWRQQAQEAFLAGYNDAIGEASFYPADPNSAAALLELFTLQKLFYEVAYEAANRPTWLSIPLSGLHDLFRGTGTEDTDGHD
ncbi:maltose alpha-D-glucosyltransferase/ alpha-amylase [Arboricoccus pini]|uniref:Maltokinase n=1 Tax=Arboricoccus pini TaxID=1963835 RepID=A0A212R8C6_9PROT|nr:maltose alpha-D-glucosyltransferase [Arboricoccus pini]SNB68447.1 maltose alpha-D-glucosyltransferase/ alpha-amylase [Arboricoccus pini]